MQRVAIYVRVSTTEQALEGYSIPAQLSLLKKYAETYKYIIYKIYQDAGISGKNIEDRPGLLQLIEDAKLEKFDLVMIWKLSRLSRSLLDLLSVVNTLNQHKISLLSYSEHFDTSTPIGKMLLQLLGSIAEFERNTIIENVKLGMSERFKQGLSKSSIPFGYYYEGKNIYIDEHKSFAIKEIFKRYLEGASINNLVDYLNSQGFKNRINRPWRYEVVFRMLQNEFYIGYVTTGRKDLKTSKYEKCKGIHAPIINEELFMKVQKKININKKAAYVRKPDADQLLSGIICCPLCGKAMYYVESFNTKKGCKYYTPLYRCGASNVNRKQCKGFSISKRKVDEQVLKKLESIIDHDIVNELAQKAINIKNNEIVQDKLNLVEMNLNEAIKVRDKYIILFETGKVNMDIFSDRINELIGKITTYQKEKENLKNELYAQDVDLTEVLKSIKTFINLYQFLTPQERRETISALIKKVTLNSDKEIEIIELVGGFIL